MNVKDLNNIFLAGSYLGSTPAIDHNLYIKDNIIYLANYRAGMRVLKVNNYDSANIEEIGYFDVHPGSDSASFNGAWSVYPYFSSGSVLISSIEGGLFVVKADGAGPPSPTNAPTPAPPTSPPTAFVCSGGLTPVEFHLLTDEWSDEDNHVQIIDVSTGNVVLMRADNTYSTVAGVLEVDRVCLPAGQYRITFYDDFGDALLANSYFKLFVGGVEKWNDDGVASSVKEVSHDFSIGSTKSTPAPTKAPTKPPTPAPVKQPTSAPVKQPTPAPVKQPTPAPSKAPTPSPTKVPASAPVKQPTPAPSSGNLGPCASGQKLASFELLTDNWSRDDNYFEIVDRTSNQVKLSRAKGQYPVGAGRLQSDSACLSAGGYKITVYDDWPTDGLTGDSYFKLLIDGKEEWSSSSVAEVFDVASYEFTITGASCPNGQSPAVFELMTDEWSNVDNHFEIINLTTNQVMLSRTKGNYPQGAGKLQSDTVCLPSGDYKITVYDDFPTDGLTSTSYFRFSINGVVRWTDGNIPEIFTAESYKFSL
jgi:hypothetical protein